MDVALAGLSAAERYKLLIGLVVPRPIAFVSTRSADGRHNAAPFSFFNLFAETPPTVVLGINDRARGPKDSARNIEATGAFVVNVVSAALLEQVNLCSAELPPEADEIALAGLTAVPAAAVAAPRIAEAPASLECRLTQIIAIGPARRLVIGEIVHVHLREGLLGPGWKVDPAALDAIGRLGGPWYARTRDLIRLDRPRGPVGGIPQIE